MSRTGARRRPKEAGAESKFEVGTLHATVPGSGVPVPVPVPARTTSNEQSPTRHEVGVIEMKAGVDDIDEFRFAGFAADLDGKGERAVLEAVGQAMGEAALISQRLGLSHWRGNHRRFARRLVERCESGTGETARAAFGFVLVVPA